MGISPEIFSIILILFPGIVSVAVFRWAADFQSNTVFDNIIAALIITLISHLISKYIFGSSFLDIEIKPDANVQARLSALLNFANYAAIVVGLVIAITWVVIRNYAWDYWLLNKLKITQRVNRETSWHTILSRRVWVRIKFADGTILIGWPEYYDDEKKAKGVFLRDAMWFYPKRKQTHRKFLKDREYRSHKVNGGGVYVPLFDQILAVEVLGGEK